MHARASFNLVCVQTQMMKYKGGKSHFMIYMLTRDVKPQKNTPSVLPGIFGNSIHAKRDAIPSLRIG